MGCQPIVEVGKNLTFSVCTHEPATGVLTDADAVPIYRIYEDETSTPILTGSMSKLDDSNTTGFYSEQIACTAANGFENGKSYTIYITAAVGGDTGGVSYGFMCVTTISALGAGATAYEYTVTDSDTGGPIANTYVWVTSDSAGLFVVGSGYTDDFGVVTFYLDAGTYYFWQTEVITTSY